MGKCTLCGSALDMNKRCTFCGLDNTKNDDMYKRMINQNDCADEPLTHIHHGTFEITSQRKEKSVDFKKILGIIVLIITIIGYIIGMFGE